MNGQIGKENDADKSIILLTNEATTYLWNEIMRTAGYIANGTPMQKHRWITPFEQAEGMSPNLSHLRKIGCIGIGYQTYRLVHKTLRWVLCHVRGNTVILMVYSMLRIILSLP